MQRARLRDALSWSAAAEQLELLRREQAKAALREGEKLNVRQHGSLVRPGIGTATFGPRCPHALARRPSALQSRARAWPAVQP